MFTIVQQFVGQRAVGGAEQVRSGVVCEGDLAVEVLKKAACE